MSEPDAGPLTGMNPRLPPRSVADPPRPYFLLAVFVLIAAGVVVAGHVYHRSFELHFRRDAEARLTEVAELKADELASWRAERLGDGGVFFANPAFSVLVRRHLDDPADGSAGPKLRTWIGRMQTSFQYDQFRLLDPQGVTRLSEPADLAPVTAAVRQTVAHSLRTGYPILQDFYRNESNGWINLAVVVPIFSDVDPARPLGALVLRIDPTTRLYPMLGRWPAPSPSAEIMLLRRAGDTAQVLNTLRFHPDAALSLAFPFTRTDVPGVRAVLGESGYVDGTDYRGVPTMAVVVPVVGSPWHLVAKLDTAEALAPFRERLWSTVALMVVLLIALAASLLVVWRRQRQRDWQQRFEAAEALRQSESQFRLVLESISLVGVMLDVAGRITLCNDCLLRLTGWKRDEVMHQSWFGLFLPPEIRDSIEREIFLKAIHAGDIPPQYQNEIVTRAGARRLIAWNNSVLRDAGGVVIGVASIGEDITARKHAEIYRNIGWEVLQILNEQGALVESVPRIVDVMKQRTGFDAMGIRLEEENDYPYFASDGFSAEFLRKENSLIGRTRDGGVCRDKTGKVCLECTCGLVISERTDPASPFCTPGGSWWTNDSLPLLDLRAEEDPRFHPRNTCIHQGYASVALIPIRSADRTVGLIQINHRRKGFFSRDAIEHLEIIANHIGTALLRKRVEAAQRETHEMIVKLTNLVPGVVYQYRLNPDGSSCFPFSSQGMNDIYEVTPEAVQQDATPVFGYLHPDDYQRIVADIQESARTLRPFHCEYRVLLPRQGLRWRMSDALPERTADGGTLWYGIITDVTERKLADEALKASLREKEALLKEVHHRVKNNLQVMTSLVRLEAGRTAVPDTRTVLRDMQGRIHSMALLHESLYRSGTFAAVDLGAYLGKITTHLFRTMVVNQAPVRLQLDLAAVRVEMDQAMPCGLLINELVSNCLKHGFPDGRAGEIRVELRLADDGPGLRLRVSDTGVGLPANFAARRDRSLGLQLVSDLARQLESTLEIGPGPAAVFTVSFMPALPQEKTDGRER